MLEKIAAFLEREAGYHLLSLVLIAVGIWFIDGVSRAQLARDVAMIGIGYMGRSMGQSKA